MDLLTVWILYAVIGVSVYSALFIWAVRSGQFSDQQRARHLPLECPPTVHAKADAPEQEREG